MGLQCPQSLVPSGANTLIPSVLWTSTALRRSNASDQSDALSELRVPVLVTRLISIFLLDHPTNTEPDS